MSDTTDLMGVRADNAAAASDAAAPASGAATGTATRRRRSGTGIDGMVLAELQQVASGLGIKGTARMRKGQLIGLVVDMNKETSELVILNADDFAGTPQAVIHLPHRIPPGFHGNWVAD